MTEKLKAFLIFNDEENLRKACRFYRVDIELVTEINSCVKKINVGGHQMLMLPCLRWPHAESRYEPSFPAYWRTCSSALFTYTYSGKVICRYSGKCPVPESDMESALSTIVPYVEKFYDGMLGMGARRTEVIENVELQDNDPYVWLAAKIQNVPVENISNKDRETAREAFTELQQFLAQKA